MKELKLIFAGLDNAGKTSFLIALRKKYNFYERVKQLKPTIKIEYSSFSFLDRFMINFWDMGGQAKYRKIYLDNTIYFSNTDFLYFLIDIKDDLRFQDSVKYLHELLDIYRDEKMEYTNEVVICFNKYDPEYRENEEFTDRADMLKKLILSQNKDLKFKFFNTTYYDISTLSKAMSYSLNKLLNLKQINMKLEKIVKNYDCSYAILFSESGLMISDYYKNIIDFRDFDKKVCRVNESLEFFQRLVDEDVKLDEKLTFSEERTEYVRKYDIDDENGKITFYLGICAPVKNLDSIKLELNDFQEALISL
ncbi:MAG: ADP-ribosylation factor-like protein [Promethearchaeota archaeon]